MSMSLLYTPSTCAKRCLMSMALSCIQCVSAGKPAPPLQRWSEERLAFPGTAYARDRTSQREEVIDRACKVARDRSPVLVQTWLVWEPILSSIHKRKECQCREINSLPLVSEKNAMQNLSFSRWGSSLMTQPSIMLPSRHVHVYIHFPYIISLPTLLSELPE